MQSERFVFIGDRGVLPDRTVHFGDLIEAGEATDFPVIPHSLFRPGMSQADAMKVVLAPKSDERNSAIADPIEDETNSQEKE